MSYGKIFEICKKYFFKKNDADLMEQLLRDKDLYHVKYYEDVIAKDKELKVLLKDFAEKNNLNVSDM